MINIDSLSYLDHGDDPINAFRQWYEKSPMGNSIIYFHGFLAEYLSYKKNKPTGKMQKHILNMAERGEVQLTQFRRYGERNYSYIARKMVE